jgi:hypothetical protein
MDNNYGTGPLFSDAVRADFAHNYSLVHLGQYFDVYRCNAGAADSVRHASR